MRGIVQVYPDWGYRLAHGRAVNCGWAVSRNRFHRLWQKHGLQQPLRVPRRKVIAGLKLDPQPLIRNHVWCYDFVHDRDAAGRTCLPQAGDPLSHGQGRGDGLPACSRQAPWRSCQPQVTAPKTCAGCWSAWSRPTAIRPACSRQAYLRSDRGGEFIAHELRQWLEDNGIKPAYIDAGKPWQNGSSESFNGTLRRGCLNRHEFHGIADATVKMEEWRRIYNEIRPHSRLGYLPAAGRSAVGLSLLPGTVPGS